MTKKNNTIKKNSLAGFIQHLDTPVVACKKDFAKAVGVSTVTVNNWCNGATTKVDLKALAALLVLDKGKGEGLRQYLAKTFLTKPEIKQLQKIAAKA